VLARLLVTAIGTILKEVPYEIVILSVLESAATTLHQLGAADMEVAHLLMVAVLLHLLGVALVMVAVVRRTPDPATPVLMAQIDDIRII